MNAPMTNPYCRRSRLAQPTFMTVVQGFARGESASELARKTGVSTKSVIKLYQRLRRRIARERERINPLAPLVLDPGDRRVRGRRPEIGENTPKLVGLRLVGQQLICEWVNADNAMEAFRVLYGAVSFDAERHAWGYQGLIDMETGRCRRLGRGSPISPDATHPLSLEQFWVTLRHRTETHCGWPPKNLYLHLKETEWRHSYLGRDPGPDLLKLLRACPI